MPDPQSDKEVTLELVKQLDDDGTFEDIMYKLHVLQKIDRGQRDAGEDRVTPHDEVQHR